MKNLIPIPKERVLEFLPYIEKYIKSAMETGSGETTYESLIGRALMNDAVFWLGMDDKKVVGMASTEIIEYPEYKMVHLITVGGDNGFGFEDFHHVLEDYTRLVGATRIQFWGRKGWSRAINKVTGKNDEKYKETYRVFSMSIE